MIEIENRRAQADRYAAGQGLRLTAHVQPPAAGPRARDVVPADFVEVERRADERDVRERLRDWMMRAIQLRRLATRSTKRSTALAKPSSSQLSVTASAAAWTSGLAFPIAMPNPAR